jgi:hypothetical protein
MWSRCIYSSQFSATFVDMIEKIPAQHSKIDTSVCFAGTLPQQVLLWNCKGRGGVSNVVARPGTSNHESGTAVDIQNSAQVRSAMQSSGFRWFGPSDSMHYDWKGSGAVNIKSLSVKAFIALYNSKGGKGKLAQSDSYNDAIGRAIKASPVGGWPGFKCGGSAPAPKPPPPKTAPTPKPPPKSAPKAAPAPILRPHPKPEPEPDPEPDPQIEPEPEREPTPEPEPDPEYVPEPEPVDEQPTESEQTEVDTPEPDQAEPKRDWRDNLPWNRPKGQSNGGLSLPARPKDGRKWTDAFALLGQKFEVALGNVRKLKPKPKPKPKPEAVQPDDPVEEQ